MYTKLVSLEGFASFAASMVARRLALKVAKRLALKKARQLALRKARRLALKKARELAMRRMSERNQIQGMSRILRRPRKLKHIKYRALWK